MDNNNSHALVNTILLNKFLQVYNNNEPPSTREKQLLFDKQSNQLISNEKFEKTMQQNLKLCSQNFITIQNVWHLQLIDFIEQYIQDYSIINFHKSSMLLDSAIKILDYKMKSLKSSIKCLKSILFLCQDCEATDSSQQQEQEQQNATTSKFVSKKKLLSKRQFLEKEEDLRRPMNELIDPINWFTIMRHKQQQCSNSIFFLNEMEVNEQLELQLDLQNCYSDFSLQCMQKQEQPQLASSSASGTLLEQDTVMTEFAQEEERDEIEFGGGFDNDDWEEVNFENKEDTNKPILDFSILEFQPLPLSTKEIPNYGKEWKQILLQNSSKQQQNKYTVSFTPETLHEPQWNALFLMDTIVLSSNTEHPNTTVSTWQYNPSKFGIAAKRVDDKQEEDVVHSELGGFDHSVESNGWEDEEQGVSMEQVFNQVFHSNLLNTAISSTIEKQNKKEKLKVETNVSNTVDVLQLKNELKIKIKEKEQTRLSEIMDQRTSVAMNLICLLHVCNEQNWSLEQEQDYSDVTIHTKEHEDRI